LRSVTPASDPAATRTAAAISVKSLAGRDPLRSPGLDRALVEEYLLFDACVGGARRVDVHPLVLPRSLHEAAIETATAACRVISDVAKAAHHSEEERARYGLADDVCRLAEASFLSGDDAALVRLDLLYGADERFYVCEVNADCPGGHNEATGLPELAQRAGFFSGLNPTRMLDALADRLCQLAQRPGPGQGVVALVYATAYAEDLQVCALLRRALLCRGVKAVLTPPTALRHKDGVLWALGSAVAALYRFYPTEYLQGQRNLDGIVAAVRGGGLRTLSSFAQIYAQSKLAFARAFAQKRAGALSAAAAETLQRFVPETFEITEVERSELVSRRDGWVLKRALGRVGDEVFVGELFNDEEWSQIVDAVLAAVTERGERFIAQRYVPQRPIATPFGDRLLTLGVYLLDGRFVGYFARVSEQSHVTHDTLCVPVFVGTEVA
jgi:hypothetical protein